LDRRRGRAVTDVARKTTVFLGLAFVAYYLVTQPEGAADAVRGAMDAVVQAMNAIIRFFSALAE
jgi:hypothetical protein